MAPSRFVLCLALVSCGQFDAADEGEQGNSRDGAALTGGEFEGAGPGCGADWVAARGASSYGEGHDSKQSCRVCENDVASGGASLVYLSPTKRLTLPRPSGQVRLSAWIRIEGNVTGTGRIQVIRHDEAGASLSPPVEGTSIDLFAQWREASLTFRPGTDVASVDVSVVVQIPNAACVGIDDVRVVLTP